MSATHSGHLPDTTARMQDVQQKEMLPHQSRQDSNLQSRVNLPKTCRDTSCQNNSSQVVHMIDFPNSHNRSLADYKHKFITPSKFYNDAQMARVINTSNTQSTKLVEQKKKILAKKESFERKQQTHDYLSEYQSNKISNPSTKKGNIRFLTQLGRYNDTELKHKNSKSMEVMSRMANNTLPPIQNNNSAYLQQGKNMKGKKKQANSAMKQMPAPPMKMAKDMTGFYPVAETLVEPKHFPKVKPQRRQQNSTQRIQNKQSYNLIEHSLFSLPQSQWQSTKGLKDKKHEYYDSDGGLHQPRMQLQQKPKKQLITKEIYYGKTDEDHDAKDEQPANHKHNKRANKNKRYVNRSLVVPRDKKPQWIH